MGRRIMIVLGMVILVSATVITAAASMGHDQGGMTDPVSGVMTDDQNIAMDGTPGAVANMGTAMGSVFENSDSMSMTDGMTVGGFGHYGPFDVDTSKDIFIDPNTFTTFTGMAFMDENHDGIEDLFQNSDRFHSLQLGDWVDQNEDGIGDLFQTANFYMYMELNNFVDVDGDGLCDNYELMPMSIQYGSQNPGSMGMANFMGATGSQHYDAFVVDISMDVFTNPETFMGLTGMEFTDADNDSIADMFQNTLLYNAMGVGPWVDQNGDGIADMFQTLGMYNVMGMSNFIDINGDGLCDNYVLNASDMTLGDN